MRNMLLILLLSLPAATVLAREEKPDPESRFWEARNVLLVQGDAASAAELFRTIVKQAPKSSRADDCLYWMGRCYVRLKDREPDAVEAFLRLIREHAASPFVDDSARELAKLGDRTIVPELTRRLQGSGPAARLAAQGLAELGEKSGIEWLAKSDGPRSAAKPVPADDPAEGAAKEKVSLEEEVRRLKEEVRRLRKELDESLALLKKLLEKKKLAPGENK